MPEMRYGNTVNKWKPTPSDLPELLTPLEVAEMLNVTRRTVYRWIKAGRMKPQKVGDLLVQIPVTEVQRFLAESNAGTNAGVAVIPEDDDVLDETDAGAVQAELLNRPITTNQTKNKPAPKGRRR